MASGVLNQLVPGAGILEDIYTAPARVEIGLMIHGCNTGMGTAKVRVSIAIGGAVDDPKQYINYDTEVMPGGVIDAAAPLNPGDVVRVYSDTGSVSFTAMGTETRF